MKGAETGVCQNK